MKNKKNILIVHNYYQVPGGEDIVVANEKKMLENHGHKVILYSRYNNELKSMSGIQKLTLLFTTIFNIRTYKEIKRIVRDENIDLVHVHNTLNLLSPSVYYAAISCEIPVIQTIHNFRLLCPAATFYRDERICEDCLNKGLSCAVKHSCYRGSKLQTLACVINTKIHRLTGIYGKINYICLTDFNKEKLLNLKQIDPNRIFIKPNFVNEDSADILDNRDNQFVFAGRLDRLKGIDILLEAWKYMGKTAPKLIVCGTGPLEDWCREFIGTNNCNVELKGYVSSEEVKKLVAKSKALILPTKWYEGFPMSIVEAYSVGTPVIASDLGNTASLIVNGVTGYKLANVTAQEIVKVVTESVLDTNIYRSTYAWFKKKYTEEINYKLLCEIYNNV